MVRSTSGAKVTSTSTSLSGRKPSRSTEPNRSNSITFHVRQKAASAASSGGIRAVTFISLSLTLSSIDAAVRPPLGASPQWSDGGWRTGVRPQASSERISAVTIPRRSWS